MNRTIQFLLVARDQASATFDKVGSAAERSGSRIGNVLKTVGTGALLGAGAAAAAGLASVARSAFTGAQEAAQITKVLNSQIANLGPTGRAAFGSAAQFAEDLGAKIGQDDDDIKAVQTKLASFPDAFRAGSLGADAMRRATAAAFDLQAIGIGSAESNIIGIGKALNDPIKGMTALSKAGVSFSEAQKTAIKQAVAQGDLAKAQSIILQGIESNAKGAAEAGVSNIQKLKVSAANLAEGIAGQLLPVIEKFAGFLLDKLPQAQAVFGRIAGAVKGLFDLFVRGDFTGGLREALGIEEDSEIVAILFRLRDTVINVFNAVKAQFQAGAAVAGPALRQIGQVITGQVLPAFASFIRAAAPIVSFLISVLAPVVRTVFATVLTVIRGAFQIIAGVFNVFAALLSGDWRRLWTGIGQILRGAVTILGGLARLAVAALLAAFRAGIAGARAVFTQINSAVAAVARGLIGVLRGIGSQIVQGLVNGIRGAAGAVQSAARDIINRIPVAIRRAMGIGSPSKVTRALGANVMSSFALGMRDEAAGAETAFTDLTLRPAAATGARAADMIQVIVHAGAVGSEDYLARTIRDVLARTQARGYGY